MQQCSKILSKEGQEGEGENNLSLSFYNNKNV